MCGSPLAVAVRAPFRRRATQGRKAHAWAGARHLTLRRLLHFHRFEVTRSAAADLLIAAIPQGGPVVAAITVGLQWLADGVLRAHATMLAMPLPAAPRLAVWRGGAGKD